MITIQLIILVINALCIYIVHNSEIKVGIRSKWNSEYEPFKLPIILWLVIFIVMFIPIVNVVAIIIYISILGYDYSDGTLKLKENFWLSKKI